jgi:cell division protein FtsI (penicillin-binding protein 3)
MRGELALGNQSSNIGMSRIFDALGGERLKRGLQRFGVRAPVHDSGSLGGALAAIGQREITTTPQALASAYALVANGGVTGSRRVLRESTARAVVSLLEGAVSSARATGSAARIAGVRVAGKTGTSDVGSAKQTRVLASFVGIVPAGQPRFVIYVGVESANGKTSGGTAAAPSFARVASAFLGRK